MKYGSRLAAILVAAFLLPVAAQAKDDTNEPPDFYRAMLHRVFSEAHRTDVVAATTIIPSFSSEQMVALRQVGDHYEILTFTPEIH